MMNVQMQDFVTYVRSEMLTRMQNASQAGGAIIPLRRPVMVVPVAHRPDRKK